MLNETEKILINESVKMRQMLTGSKYNEDGLVRIYLSTPVSDYFRHDAALGGYVPHKRKLRKRNFFD